MIRHGQSHVNLPSWNNGNTDEGLTELGKQQAAALGRWMPTEIPAIDVLYSSTMRRARETAAYLESAYGQQAQYDDRLREVGNNRLDHTPWPNDKLPPEYANYWSSERPFAPVTPTVENGETMMHFRTRVGLFIEELVQRHPEEIVVAVCHGGVIEVAFDHVFNVGAFRHCEVWTKNTGISHFEFVNHPRRETWRLHGHNRVEHLIGIEETVVDEIEETPV
jgi:probable phosphoglycerate mutase